MRSVAFVAGIIGMLSLAWAETNCVYILTGQSNSLGAVKGTPAGTELLQRYSSPAMLWNGNMVRDTGKCFDESPSWQELAPQLPEYNGTLCMGPEYGFAYMMHRRKWHTQGGSKLYIVKASLDGGGNRFWMEGQPAFRSLSGTLNQALTVLKGKTQVQALLYLQGESDKGEEISRAPERFLDLVARLRKVAKKGLKYAVAGECATWHGKEATDSAGNATAQLMYAMTQKKKNIGWVRTRDLTKITAGDALGVHYDGKSQLTIGARYAYAAAMLEKLPLAHAVRGDDPAASLDSPAAWWGGKLPQAETVVCWDLSAANAEDALARDMSVAGLLVEDPFRGVVSIAPAEGKSPTLHVGVKGICLKEADLVLLCTLDATADQVWQLEADRSLVLGAAAAPIALEGSAQITLKAAAGARVELHLKSAPSHTWIVPEGVEVVASIAGRPACLRQENGVCKLVPEAS